MGSGVNNHKFRLKIKKEVRNKAVYLALVSMGSAKQFILEVTELCFVFPEIQYNRIANIFYDFCRITHILYNSKLPLSEYFHPFQ